MIQGHGTKHFWTKISFSKCHVIIEWSVFLNQYRAGDKIETNEMGGECSVYGRRERCVQRSGGET
jgi:hypothetical protein